MAQDLALSMKLLLNSQQLVAGLNFGTRAVSRFSGVVREGFGRLRETFDSVEGRLAAVGVGIGVVENLVEAARLDKKFSQVALAASALPPQIAALREQLPELARESGQSVDTLLAGFKELATNGLSWQASVNSIEAVNRTAAITNENVVALAQNLTTASSAFDIDMSKPKAANEVLAQMTVASRLGKTGLTELNGILSRVAVNANTAGLSLPKTLALIEGLSTAGSARLGNMVDSTLRLFTDQNLLRNARRATGVRFYDTSGERRDPMEVLRDLKARYERMTTTRSQENFIERAFGQTDATAIKGLRLFLGSDMLDKVDNIDDALKHASELFEKNMTQATDNAVDQGNRLKVVLKETAESFARPIETVLGKMIKVTLDSRKDGGLGLSGGEIVGGAAGLAGAAMLWKSGALGKIFKGTPVLRDAIGTPISAAGKGGLLSRLLGNGVNLAQGVAVGQALKAAGGAAPVYVVNMPEAGVTPASEVANGSLMKRMTPWLAGATAFTGFAVGGAWLTDRMTHSQGFDNRRRSSWLDGDMGVPLREAADFERDLVALKEKKSPKFEGSLKIELFSSDKNKLKVKDVKVNWPGFDIDFEHRGSLLEYP